MNLRVGATYRMKAQRGGHPMKPRTIVDLDEDRVKSNTGPSPAGKVWSEWMSRRWFEEHVEEEVV